MREKQWYKEKIIEMVENIKYQNILEYIYWVIKPIYEKTERSE